MSSRALVLCRSPLQAFIANALLGFLCIKNFDLVYFTYHDGVKDRYYFNSLGLRAGEKCYLSVRRRKKEAIHHWFIYNSLPRCFKAKSYDRIILASFDSFLFRMLASNNPRACVTTIDDGAANVMSSSSYYRYLPSRGVFLYEKLFRINSISDFKKNIVEHYSIYPNIKNIVDGPRLRFIDPWAGRSRAGAVLGSGAVSFFIGQPFDEVLAARYFDQASLGRFVDYLKSVKIDYYLQHPRETQPIDVGGVLVNDAEKIAEEVVFDMSGGGRPIIYGWFSTVLLNVNAEHADKIYLSIGSSDEELERISMVEQAGCKVVKI